MTHKCPGIDNKNCLQIDSSYQAGISYFPLLPFLLVCFFACGLLSLPCCRLTLSLPEDPCAHELEEAAGIKPGPVHRDRVLKTGRENIGVLVDVRICDQIKGSFIKAAGSDFSRVSTYAIVHQGFPRVFQLFNEPGEKQNKKKPCHKCIRLPNNFPFMLDQT